MGPLLVAVTVWRTRSPAVPSKATSVRLRLSDGPTEVGGAGGAAAGAPGEAWEGGLGGEVVVEEDKDAAPGEVVEVLHAREGKSRSHREHATRHSDANGSFPPRVRSVCVSRGRGENAIVGAADPLGRDDAGGSRVGGAGDGCVGGRSRPLCRATKQAARILRKEQEGGGEGREGGTGGNGGREKYQREEDGHQTAKSRAVVVPAVPLELARHQRNHHKFKKKAGRGGRTCSGAQPAFPRQRRPLQRVAAFQGPWEWWGGWRWKSREREGKGERGGNSARRTAIWQRMLGQGRVGGLGQQAGGCHVTAGCA